MAWRIHESVIRGEIDNREKGIVRGRVWMHGGGQPIELELLGNAHPDLAGCLLTFENSRPTLALPEGFHPRQGGTIGDLTASRKYRVFDVTLEEALGMLRRGERPPEHMANCLYLEWFSAANGRVVVESADYRLWISPPTWRMSSEEDEARARLVAEGLSDYLGRFASGFDAPGRENPEDDD